MAAKKATATKPAAPLKKKVTADQAPQGETSVAPVAVPDSGPGASKREFTPITVVAVVDELPDAEDAAVSDAVLQAIIDNPGKWVEVSTGGRKPNTTRNNVVKALAKKSVNAKTRVIGDKVHVSAIAE